MGIKIDTRNKEYTPFSNRDADYVDQVMAEHKGSLALDHPDGSVTDEKIGNRTVNDGGSTFTAKLSAILAKLASEIRLIKGSSAFGGALDSNINTLNEDVEELSYNIINHKNSSQHDTRYYTKPQIDEKISNVDIAGRSAIASLDGHINNTYMHMTTNDRNNINKLMSIESGPSVAFYTHVVLQNPVYNGVSLPQNASFIPSSEENAEDILNSIIESVSTNGGGTIFIGKGNYKIGSSILLKSNVSLLGEDGAVLEATGESYNIVSSISAIENVSIKNLTFKGNSRTHQYGQYSYQYEVLGSNGINLTYDNKNICFSGNTMIDGISGINLTGDGLRIEGNLFDLANGQSYSGNGYDMEQICVITINNKNLGLCRYAYITDNHFSSMAHFRCSCIIMSGSRFIISRNIADRGSSSIYSDRLFIANSNATKVMGFGNIAETFTVNYIYPEPPTWRFFGNICDFESTNPAAYNDSTINGGFASR